VFNVLRYLRLHNRWKRIAFVQEFERALRRGPQDTCCLKFLIVETFDPLLQ
jgi:hypothetical protein